MEYYINSGGFRGGGHSRLVPPLLKHFFYKCPPFLYMCPPLLKPKKNLKKKTLKKKEKRCLIPPGYTLVATYPPPPPPPDVDGAPEKKVSESPPAYQLFWDLREFQGWRRSGKKQYVVPPLSQIPGSAPVSRSLILMHFSFIHSSIQFNSIHSFILRGYYSFIYLFIHSVRQSVLELITCRNGTKLITFSFSCQKLINSFNSGIYKT